MKTTTCLSRFKSKKIIKTADNSSILTGEEKRRRGQNSSVPGYLYYLVEGKCSCLDWGGGGGGEAGRERLLAVLSCLNQVQRNFCVPSDTGGWTFETCV